MAVCPRKRRSTLRRAPPPRRTIVDIAGICHTNSRASKSGVEAPPAGASEAKTRVMMDVDPNDEPDEGLPVQAVIGRDHPMVVFDDNRFCAGRSLGPGPMRRRVATSCDSSA